MPINIIYKSRKILVDSINPSVHTLGYLKLHLLQNHEVCQLAGTQVTPPAAVDGIDQVPPSNSKSPLINRRKSGDGDENGKRVKGLMKMMKLLCSGLVMADDSTLLSQYGVQPNSKIMMMFTPPSVSSSFYSTGASSGKVDGLEAMHKRKFQSSTDSILDSKGAVLNSNKEPKRSAKRRILNNLIIESVLNRSCILLHCLISEYHQFLTNDSTSNSDTLTTILRDLFNLVIDSTESKDTNYNEMLDTLVRSIPNQSSETASLLSDKPHITYSAADREKWEEKWYRYLNEKLMRLILQLDVVDTQGDADLRLLRKHCVNAVQSILDFLDTIHNEHKKS